ncbi:hypothetical protein [Bradyrhizobium sp. JR3.5]
MRPPDKPPNGKDKPPPKLTLTDQAREVAKEYANDLREIVKKLLKKTH